MGKKFSQVRVEDRIKIYEMLYAGNSIREIAAKLNKHYTTIYRELIRNCHKDGYRPDFANEECKYRQKLKTVSKLEKDIDLKNQVVDLLKSGLSPELIAGRIKLEHGANKISRESIYRYIYSQAGKAQKLYQFLYQKRRFRYPRGSKRPYIKKNKPSIHERAECINDRSTFGHWEGDLVIFSKIRTNLITLRERKSRYIYAFKNESRKALSTANTLVKYMKQAHVYSLTLDNGSEFANYQNIAGQLNTNIYFCDPYKSYQKGAVENANRLLRSELPRKTDLNKYNQQQINDIVNKLNNRPMKCLGFKTPNEVYEECCSLISGTI